MADSSANFVLSWSKFLLEKRLEQAEKVLDQCYDYLAYGTSHASEVLDAITDYRVNTRFAGPISEPQEPDAR